MSISKETSIRILCLEDKEKDAALIQEFLQEGFESLNFKWVKSKLEYLSALDNGSYDIILSDYRLPDINGLEALKYAREMCPETPYICVSGTIGEEAAVELLTNGAVDYIIKDRIHRLAKAVINAIDAAKLKAENIAAIDKIKESEQLLNSIANTTPGMMWMSGPEMGCTWLNQAWLDFRGRDLAEEIGNGWVEGVHPEDLADCWESYKTAFQSRKPYFKEYRLKYHDGTYRWVLDTGKPRYDSKNEFAGYIGACMDITDRRAQEAEIKQLNIGLEKRVKNRTSQLEELLKDMETFSYSASHDLRAPLRIIGGYATVLQEDYGDKVDAEGNETINRILAGVTRMNNLIEDLLLLSKVVRSDLKFETIDMTQKAMKVYDEITDESTKKAYSLTIHPLASISGDRVLIYQVWANLISNAIKYSKPSVVKNITIGCISEQDFVTYYVQDTGVGFDMEYIDKLFGVFSRLHNSREFEGTGIGLANVKRIIERHGGSVWATSILTEGSTFYFKLPINKGDTND